MENKIERISIIVIASLIVLVCVIAFFSWLSTSKVTNEMTEEKERIRTEQEDSLYRNFQTADLQTFELHGFVKEVSIDGKTFCRFDNQGRLTYIDFEGAEDIEGYSLGWKFLISYEDDPEFGTITDENGDIYDYIRENEHIRRFMEPREELGPAYLLSWDYDSDGRRTYTEWCIGGGEESQTFSDFLPNGIHQKVVKEWGSSHSYSEGTSVGTLSDFAYDEFGNWTYMTIRFENTIKKWNNDGVYGSDEPEDFTITNTETTKKVKRTITYYDKSEVVVK